MTAQTPAPIPADVLDAAVEVAARAAAMHEDYDGCFERVDAWAALSEEEKSYTEQGNVVADSDYEDCEWWRARERAALTAALPRVIAAAEADALEEAANALHDVSLPVSPYERRLGVRDWLRVLAATYRKADR